MGEVQPDLANEEGLQNSSTLSKEEQMLVNIPKTDESYVTENDLDLIDIASLFTDEEYADLY